MNILMLAKNSESSRYMYNAISKEFNIHSVVFEANTHKKKLIKRRIKKLGPIKVAGQLLFQTIVVSFLKVVSKNRIQEIIKDNLLDNSNIGIPTPVFVKSINEDIVIEEIRKVCPDVILVNGTGIISKKILNATTAKFINTHVGITPKYRGVHGGYWALVNNDPENCGVTIHLIDEGIDTGKIIYQDTIKITKKDNFITYPLLQVSKGIDLMKNALKDLKDNKLEAHNNYLESKLWYHPTLWEYMYYRIIKRIK